MTARERDDRLPPALCWLLIGLASVALWSVIIAFSATVWGLT